MNMYEEQYKKKCMTAKEALELIKDKDVIFTPMAVSGPDAILSEMQYLKETGVKDVILHTCIPSKDQPVFHDPEMKGVLKHHGWFFTAGLRKAWDEGLVSAVPQHSTSILRKTFDRIDREGRRPVLLTTVSPMDKNGYLSLSVSAIYEMDVIQRGDALVIVEVNPNYPRTFGDTMVHISQIDAIVESDRPIMCVDLVPYTDVDEKIGKNVASLVEDGSTIQLGIGNIPNAVANELKTKKHLGIHTEMFTETMIDLIECGAVDNTMKGFNNGISIASFTMGSKRLYEFLDNNASIFFKSSCYSNDPYTIAKNNKFVSINTILEIDLTGQCASETVGHKQFSGSGGQAETVQGSQMSKGGKSILALHSTYSTKDENGKEVLHSKIVPFLQPGAAVTTSRNDVDYVVTEYGIACLRGLTVEERVVELSKIAHPNFREWLLNEAKEKDIR